MRDSREIVKRLRASVAEALAERARREEARGHRLSREEMKAFAHQLLADALQGLATEAARSGRDPLRPADEEEIAQAVLDELFGLGALQRWIDDESVETINVNGPHNVFVRYGDGRTEQVEPVADSNEELIELLRAAGARLGLGERRFDPVAPRLDLQLPDGSRLSAVMAVSPDVSVSIRRHRLWKVTPEDLIGRRTIDRALREWGRAAVLARKNIVICGGTNVGKTTYLRALAADIPRFERIITIEDAFELALHEDADRHPDVVNWQAREANAEGEGEVSLADLVRWALRMSPDRIIVGEVRGKEVVPMLNAMSHGNDGSLTTIHANSSRGAFAKIATYAVQSPERLPLEATNLLVANAVDFVVHLAQDAAGQRFVSSVREVTGVSDDGRVVETIEVFKPGPDGRAVPRLLSATMREDLEAVGFDASLLDRPHGWWDAQ